MSGGRGGRPPGPERAALLAAAQALHQQGKAGTWRDLAASAQVGFQVARRTCWSLVKAGELQVVGYQAGTGPGRPVALLSWCPPQTAPEPVTLWGAWHPSNPTKSTQCG